VRRRNKTQGRPAKNYQSHFEGNRSSPNAIADCLGGSPLLMDTSMKKHITTLLLIFILAACSAETKTSLPNPTPTVGPTAVPEIKATEAVASPTVEATRVVVVPTETPSNIRISSIDGMPQVYIPAGTFHMGGVFFF